MSQIFRLCLLFRFFVFSTFNSASKQDECHAGGSRYPVTLKAHHCWLGWIPGQARNDEIHNIFWPDNKAKPGFSSGFQRYSRFRVVKVMRLYPAIRAASITVITD